MKDDTLQFAAVWAFIPWTPTLFFIFEIQEAGYLMPALIITAMISLVCGIVAFRSYSKIGA